MLTVACVWVGTKYPRHYVERLAHGVWRHLPHKGRFVCLTDRPAELAGVGVDAVDISGLGLEGWWAKMALFDPGIRGPGECIYLDLDTVVTGDLSPLLAWEGEFAILENLTRLAGRSWPCRYGSAVMTFQDGYGWNVWRDFDADRLGLMQRAGGHGDQMVIEWLAPGAAFLQDQMPAGFFVGWRDLRPLRPRGVSLVLFAGSHQPTNTEIEWVRTEWRT